MLGRYDCPVTRLCPSSALDEICVTINDAFRQIDAVDLSTVANVATALTVLTVVVFGLIEMRHARKEKFGDLLGATPPELNIPYLPLSPLVVVWNVLPGMIKDRLETRRDIKQCAQYITFIPNWVRDTRPRIQQCTDAVGLLSLWTEAIFPSILRSFRMLRSVITSLSAPATRHRDQ